MQHLTDDDQSYLQYPDDHSYVSSDTSLRQDAMREEGGMVRITPAARFATTGYHSTEDHSQLTHNKSSRYSL